MAEADKWDRTATLGDLNPTGRPQLPVAEPQATRSLAADPIRVTRDGADVVSETGERMEDIGAQLGRVASRAGAQGGYALRAAGAWLERAGDYLERRQFDGVRADVERAIVSRPLVALVTAVAAGYAIGRVARG